jgi:tetratricopeptide (TPR) repeat protein
LRARKFVPQRVTQIRVFAASPGDVNDERERLARVVEGLDRTLGQAEGLALKLVRWETHAWPGFGEDAQDVINREIDPYDVFVGVMWKRLGTPTMRADSGTVEEFERAYALWQQCSRPALMFYFSRAPFFPDPEDLAQFEAVSRFKDVLRDKGGLYWEYESPDEFEASVREHLYQQVHRLAVMADSQELNRSLTASGLGLAEVAGQRRSLADVSDAGEIQHVLSSLLERLDHLDAANANRIATVPPDALLDAAHGLMAAHKWTEAAEYFDRYVEVHPKNWEALYSRAVAHANSRVGAESDLMALRAYGDAIALRPPDLEPNLLARLYSYRGAMMKRLRRLQEAEADLRVADAMATNKYERDDIHYNLAGVYAMTGRRAEALQLVKSLQGTVFIGAIKANRDRYFAALANDPEFLALL